MREKFAATLLVVLISGCVNTGQLMSNTESVDMSLDPATFHHDGIGFLTPVSATGQEADRVALALSFANAVSENRPNLKVVSLANVLSSVNRAGLANDYKGMIDDYQGTGIMERDTLRQVGEASDVRYLGLLSLGEFSQATNKRFSIAGMRLFDTKQASIRLSWQIWDSQTGAIAWEGSDEIHYAYDTGRERPVNFSFVAEQAAANMMAEIPSPADAELERVAVVTAD